MFSKNESKGESRGIWFDVRRNILGFGKTYGEDSFNGQPVDAIVGEDAIEAFLGHTLKVRVKSHIRRS